MATAFSKEYFGIFMVIRRIVAIGAPLISLNLSVGLARYVSYEKENEKEFLNASILVICGLSVLSIVISIIFRNQLSLLFFNTSNHSLIIVLTAFFLFGYGIYSISYAFFRGRQEMNRANSMQVLYYLFPIMAGFILWQLFTDRYSHILSLYLISFSFWGVVLGLIFLRQNVQIGRLLPIIEKVQSVKAVFFYSFFRIPSSFFLALVFGIPVFVASQKMSLVAAGYIGIAVAIVRLMGIFATPFNLLFLPKFAEMKRNDSPREVSDTASIVASFIITVLPFFAVACYGLANYAVIIFFGKKYIAATQCVSVVILFSVFYVSSVLIRGILDGLFSFPYVNIIYSAGLLITAISSLLFHGSVLMLAVDFGLGLFVIGLAAFCILIKVANVSVKIKKVLLSLAIAMSVFVLLFFLDKWVELTAFPEYVKFGGKILYRIILLFILYLFYWKPKIIWAKEILLENK
jgi:O-antigen/teichoic acid export membrane protein